MERSCDEKRGQKLHQKNYDSIITIGRCNRGRQNKRWGEAKQQDLKCLQLKKENTGNRHKSIGRICLANPSFPKGKIN